jgi:hypothetical protein
MTDCPRAGARRTDGASNRVQGLTPRHLAAISNIPEDVSDCELAGLVGRVRTAPLWAWMRLGCPADPRGGDPLGDALRACIVQDLAATARLRSAVARLNALGIEPILLKGAGLSHGVYPQPWLRPRNDDDLLVAREDFERAGDALQRLGYDLLPANPGPEDTGQSHFTRPFAGGEVHHVDLHWRALVPPGFAGLPGYHGLRAAAKPAWPEGGAWQIDPALAMVMACAHRVAHHAPDEDPVWLVDLHFIAQALDDSTWEAMAAAAIASRTSAVCGFELARASASLGTRVPVGVRDRLAAVRGEPGARHLRARGRLHRLWIDLGDRADGRWTALAARLFPEPAYMTARYGRRTPLPVAYLWRVGAGAASWLAEAARRSRSR